MARLFRDIPIPRSVFADEERIKKGRGEPRVSDEDLKDLDFEFDNLYNQVQQFAEKGGRDDR